MAAQNWSPSKEAGNNNIAPLRLQALFKVNGTSDPDSTVTVGRGIASITYAATGRWKITFRGKWKALLAWNLNWATGNETLADCNLRLDWENSVPGSGIFYVMNVDENGVPTAPPVASANRWVSCEFVVTTTYMTK